MNEINQVRRIFTEKRPEFSVESHEILRDLRQHLKITSLTKVRLMNRYDISGLTDEEYRQAVPIVFYDPVIDQVYYEDVDLSEASYVFAIESLPGQYNQRADSASQCVQILTRNTKPDCQVAQVIALYGPVHASDCMRVTEYLINPVESRLAQHEKPISLKQSLAHPSPIQTVKDLTEMNLSDLSHLIADLGLAMSLADLAFVQEYYLLKGRNPTMTELRVLDTYWSDHCRHTTFLTVIDAVHFPDSCFGQKVKEVFKDYTEKRKRLYGENIKNKPMSLMDLATMAMKSMREKGLLQDLDESEEINACSIKVLVDVDGKNEEYLIMFKNETHNHPTEIEPFGGAATCLGGAIRDPLSGRAYVYQAMRITGSADPSVPVEQTIPGKLSQRQITTKASAGYSSYGNQIGLATGYIEELYHPGYMAKRMEIGAVIAAAKASHVVRGTPQDGDCIILVGGQTGRDGCGGATGSSKEHTEESIRTCGSEVQKGNPPTERKIQRLFRNPKVSRMIKRCNDFGAGGVCVAIGELADGIEVNLDLIPKKYEGLDGTELAISESQERMAVVVSPENENKFLQLCIQENLEAVTVAKVTSVPKMQMFWQGEKILELDREFIDTNGSPQHAIAQITDPDFRNPFLEKMPDGYRKEQFVSSLCSILKTLSCCSRKGLIEKFDSTIGAGSVLVPFGGKHQLSPEIGMAAKIPVSSGETETATLMTFGFDPYLSNWSPYHGAYYAVLESLCKISVMGGDPGETRLSFQEYFEKLGEDPTKWGKPFLALLGAYQAQIDFNTPAIGGKDSMSGTFKDLNVPPTLVSFAVSKSLASDVISACMRGKDSMVILLPPVIDDLYLPDKNVSLMQFDFVKKMRNNNKIISGSTVREGGVAVAVSKMCFGNHIGFQFSDCLSISELFSPMPSAIILELTCSEKEIIDNLDFSTLLSIKGAKILGRTIPEDQICYRDEKVCISSLLSHWESTLEEVFPSKISQPKESEKFSEINIRKSSDILPHSSVRIARPRVLMPVFPGTNCEFDTQKAFQRAGAITETFVFNNLTPKHIEQSVAALGKAIERTNIFMLPGGFSAGDEPDGSGKFIAAVLRNPYLTEKIHQLLHERDGLILGICNGFQALVKLGLLPYGEIRQLTPTTPTLAANTIGRHVSTYVQTRIVSNQSPWLMKTKPGDLHWIPISHGEGRFVAPIEMIQALNENGQIATQYVDLDGNPTDFMPYNPNGSIAAIEGITALQGRILGKMGHSERTGRYVAKNIDGEKDQPLFQSGVSYYL
jgi:phosphoribosylformylglycinamidine synthase